MSKILYRCAGSSITVTPYVEPVPDGWSIYDGIVDYDNEGAIDMVCDAGILRRRTDAERLQVVIIRRITELKGEVETYIDTSILPVTRAMLHDGVLDDITAEAIREFIADCYVEANSVIDAIEAVDTVDEVDDPAPVWPTYGGAA